MIRFTQVKLKPFLPLLCRKLAKRFQQCYVYPPYRNETITERRRRRNEYYTHSIQKHGTKAKNKHHVARGGYAMIFTRTTNTNKQLHWRYFTLFYSQTSILCCIHCTPYKYIYVILDEPCTQRFISFLSL